MSFSNSITNAVDNIVFEYIDKVAKMYSLNKTDLLNLYNSSVSLSSENKVGTGTVSSSELNKLNKTELIELCRTKKLKLSGSKVDLIQRLLEFEKEDKETPKITTKLINKIAPIQINRNKFGNFEHVETSFVFNNSTQKVYGKQLPDGKVAQLTEEDINICHKYKFTYELPINLNTMNDKVDLAELDEEEEEEEVEVEIDDDEEEEEEEIEIEEEYE